MTNLLFINRLLPEWLGRLDVDDSSSSIIIIFRNQLYLFSICIFIISCDTSIWLRKIFFWCSLIIINDNNIIIYWFVDLCSVGDNEFLMKSTG